MENKEPSIASVTPKERFLGLDLLRILSMVLVLVLHYLSFGGVLDTPTFGTPYYYLVWGLESLAYVAVNCFVLISGYFLSTSTFKASRVLKLVLHALFFSLIGLGMTLILNPAAIGLKQIIKSLTPVSSGVWWYISCYFQLLLLMPVMNTAIKGMNKRQFQLCLGCILLICSLIPCIIFWRSGQWPTGFTTLWFVALYFIAAYLRRYGTALSSKKALLVYFMSSALLLASRLVIGYTTKALLGHVTREGLFYGYNSVLIVISSLSLFVAFWKIEIKGRALSFFIRKVAPYTLGVYLFHEHDFFRSTLYSLWRIERFAAHPLFMLLYMLLFIAVMFTIGYLLDVLFSLLCKLLRVKTAEQKLDLAIEKFLTKGD